MAPAMYVTVQTVEHLRPIVSASRNARRQLSALSKGESDATVNQLAYMAKQQVAIAQETGRSESCRIGALQKNLGYIKSEGDGV